MDASCDETILSVACDVALVDAPLARVRRRRRVDGRRFRACVAPLCRTSVCSKTSARDVDDDDDGLVDARSSSLARAVCREAARFGASDASGSRELADERVQSRQRQRRARLVRVVEPERGVVGTELSSRTGDVVAAALDYLRRRAIDGVVAARRRVRDAADVDADAADVDADAAVHHLLPDAVVAVTGTVTGTVDVRRRRRWIRVTSCGLCIYPDATSDVPTCCCDDTCAEYGDCCVDVDACCPSLDKKANSRARARSRPRGSNAVGARDDAETTRRCEYRTLNTEYRIQINRPPNG